MQGNKAILDELGAISPVVAGIGSAATYRVPDGYFESFAGALTARLATPGTESTPDDPIITPNNPIITPEAPAILAGLRDRSAPYGVPVGFFDGFAGTLMRRIRADEAVSAGEELEILSPLLSRLGKKGPFTAPAGYFSELTDSLAAELQALNVVNDELGKTVESTNLPPLSADLSSLMNGLKNKQVYTVPEGYFDALAPALSARIHREGAKVVSMNRGRVRSWMKYAVAAALAGFLVTGGIRVFHRGDTPVAPSPGGDVTSNLANLAKVSDQEILNYLENQNEPLAEAVTNNTATLDINDSDVKDFLGDVPDAELQQYVDEHGSSKDPLTN